MTGSMLENPNVAAWAARRLQDLRTGRRTVADLEARLEGSMPVIAAGTRLAIAQFTNEQEQDGA